MESAPQPARDESPPPAPPPQLYAPRVIYLPPPRRGLDPALLAALVLALAVVLVLSVAFVFLTAWRFSGPGGYPPSVTVTNWGLEWMSPPSALCDGWSSEFPRTPFTVSPGTSFNLSSEAGCWNDSGPYTIDAIQSITNGFLVVSSNLPVTVTGTQVYFVNLTVSAPRSYYDGALVIWIVSHAN